MSQLPTYNNGNDGLVIRRYSGFPLNSTLVSSYTPDTIRSIISHAAAGQPYSTAVWIRINRVGIQVNAQDPQVARTRIPVFIPIGLVHDIFMLPNINNVICIVYDELQSNMKGVLLYVVHPSDAQLLRDDFRIVKQANNSQQVPPVPYSSPFDNRFSQAGDIYPFGNNPMYSPPTRTKSPMSNELHRNTINTRQSSPRRIIRIRDNETNFNQALTPMIPELAYNSIKDSFTNGEDSHRRHKSQKRGQTSSSPTKRSNDIAIKRERKHRSRSPDKRSRSKLPISNSSHELTSEAFIQQQQQLQQQWLIQQQQQQQWLLQQQQQQQQMAAMQTAQQTPPVPIGIYNRYVPKTIPLPTGETLKTALPSPGLNGAAMNGTAIAYIEPQQTTNTNDTHNVPSPMPSNSYQRQQRNRSLTTAVSPVYMQSTHHHHHSRHHHHRHLADDYIEGLSKPDANNIYGNVTHTSRSRPKYSALKDNHKTEDSEDETKQYLKMLVDEMQAMKIEMNKIRQSTLDTSKGRSDSLQGDLKEIRAHIDRIRSRMAATPKVSEN
ncbi:unnamed protein product [Rotaria sp. Silwood1]|nr:unnamed protein product [Rotaria sp. Silwood1]CAF4764030.1 unnamed protein product [Rotaria sp. Silwood1]